jgi:hypothetical protein
MKTNVLNSGNLPMQDAVKFMTLNGSLKKAEDFVYFPNCVRSGADIWNSWTMNALFMALAEDEAYEDMDPIPDEEYEDADGEIYKRRKNKLYRENPEHEPKYIWDKDEMEDLEENDYLNDDYDWNDIEPDFDWDEISDPDLRESLGDFYD